MKLKGYLLLLILAGCANSPSGAIEFNTTVYYLDGKFHKDIPEEYIHKVWGYRITDGRGVEHTYKERLSIPHQRQEIKYCTIHRKMERVKAVWAPVNEYWYYVTTPRKYNK
tara:strand:+ start:1188 stop:1520 length:333 start_codon:yes stop_codon:yes gene_type:complete